MIKISFFAFVLTIAFTSQNALAVPIPGPDAFGYTAAQIGGNLRDVSGGTGVPLTDDQVSGAIGIGFNFDYYGISYSQLYISSNGFITFTATIDSGCCTGEALPTNSAFQPNNLIAGFWEDLDSNNNNDGVIAYALSGSPGTQEFVVGFYSVPHFPGTAFGAPTVTFEMILHEGSNNIELQYGAALQDAFGTTSVGIENLDGTDGIQIALGDDIVLNNVGYLITAPTRVSEPTTLALLGLGLAGLGFSRRKKA